jgi:hypothetical protein
VLLSILSVQEISVRAPKSLKFMVILLFVDCASRYNRVMKNQLDSQLILSIFRQPLLVSGLSWPIIRRYNHMYTTIGTYYFWMTVCCPGSTSTCFGRI